MKKSGFKSLKELHDERVAMRKQSKKQDVTKEQYNARFKRIAFLMCLVMVLLQNGIMALFVNSLQFAGATDSFKPLILIAGILYCENSLRNHWGCMVKAMDMAKILLFRAFVMLGNALFHIGLLMVTGEQDMIFYIMWVLLGIFELVHLLIKSHTFSMATVKQTMVKS